ncbi:uncharacterized protein LOC116802121 [Drosophila sechellia]|uniref:GD16153 n=2 Tax=melanogaster subgroup TaxID=32351 RepID=B4R5Z9_DROSI|nr:uncharacterized protein LOC6725366 [Drosophila simulans]XP_032581230.1 uncharacterized protein LOC116802121 [Drosophila sechellia]XP_033169544.1 uncharacterized protein LOC117146985 [Drosophila mauritiana]EDX17335.1 GD16153 [Drosophila simulans]KMZ08611.1 uncharacterized protein Dsimw501_GD16153 [Drosophila simulans]
MRFCLLFFLALSCCLLQFSVAGVNLVRGLEAAGHHRNSTGSPPPRGAPPPPRTTTASSSG